jgi:hypothetical protein
LVGIMELKPKIGFEIKLELEVEFLFFHFFANILVSLSTETSLKIQEELEFKFGSQSNPSSNSSFYLFLLFMFISYTRRPWAFFFFFSFFCFFWFCRWFYSSLSILQEQLREAFITPPTSETMEVRVEPSLSYFTVSICLSLLICFFIQGSQFFETAELMDNMSFDKTIQIVQE